MAAAPQKKDVSKAFPGMENMTLEKAEFKRPEDEQEKALRLHKERMSFNVKELWTPGFAAVLVIVALVCCLVFLFNPHSSTGEKEWARSLFMSIVSGAIAFAFGKATK